MYFLCTKISLYLVANFLVIASESDPCIDYTELDDHKRSTAYLRDSSPICDTVIKEGWYRSVSKAGGDMPTLPVPSGRCGTSYPVWIDDTLPSQNEEKEVKACVVHNIYGDCHESFNIKVKNCSNFNVYYLLQTSGCPIAYCFGTQLPCPDGQSSKTGFTPGCEDTPVATTDVKRQRTSADLKSQSNNTQSGLGLTFTPGVSSAVPAIQLSLSVAAGLTDGEHAGGNVYHKVLKFDCNLGSTPDNTNGLIFEVRWYIEDNEVVIFTEKNFTNLPQTALTEDNWVGKYYMGFNVKCKMCVRYANSSITGPYYESAFFFAGFKVDKTELTVVEGGQPVDIQVSLTVPVGCAIDTTMQTTSDCTITVRAREPKYQQDKCQNGVQTGEDLVFKNLNCYLEFEHDNYTATKSLSITGKIDSLYNSNNRTAYIRLTADQSFIDNAWSYASIPDIKVSVVDKEYKLINKKCESNNDPVITTFDRSRRFGNHRAGEFILYRHNKLPVSVHAMYSACPGTWGNYATCNCGVAIRNDVALFIANFCGHITTKNYVSSMPTNRYVEKVSCEDKYMGVVHKSNEYEITLPIGTVVQFTYREFAERIIINNILIKPSIEDIKSSSGLCGYLDNDDNNPLVLRDGSTTTDYSVFAEEWRMKNASGDISLFASNLKLKEDDESLRQYCVCGNSTSEISCELSAAIELCRNKTTSPNLTKPYYVRCTEGTSRSKRSLLMYSSHSIYKRSADDEEVIDKIDLIYDPDYEDPPTEPVWMNGWNTASAEAYCVKEFDANPMVALCKDELPGYENEIEKIKDECVETIKIAGNTDFVFSSLDALRSSCLSEATRLENLTESASKSGNDSKTLLDDILDVSCVNNCSGNGTCVSGQCECFTGYDGSICNLQKSLPPTISKTSNSWKCKTDQKPCSTYGITGSGFIYGAITCKARHFQIFGDGRHQETGTVLTFAGTYVNEISCSCSFPSSRRRREASSETIIAEGYYMSVSNDGATFSEEIIFINYDSSCYECNVTSITCTEHSSCVKETTTIKTDDVTNESSTITDYETTLTLTAEDTTTTSIGTTTNVITITEAATTLTGQGSTTSNAYTVSVDDTSTNADKVTTTSSYITTATTPTTGVDTTTQITETTTTYGDDGTSTNADKATTTSSYITTATTPTTGVDTTTQITETTTTYGVDGTSSIADTVTTAKTDTDITHTTSANIPTQTTETTTTFGIDVTSTNTDTTVTTSANTYVTTINTEPDTDTTFPSVDTTKQTTEKTKTIADISTVAATGVTDGSKSVTFRATTYPDPETTTFATDTSSDSVTSKVTSSLIISKATSTSFPPTFTTERNENISDEEQNSAVMTIAIISGVFATAILMLITTVCIIKKKCVKKKNVYRERKP